MLHDNGCGARGNRPAFEAIIFDLDGTLVDSLPKIADALAELLADNGRRAATLVEAEGLVGDGAQMLVERAFALTGEPLPRDRVSRMTSRYIELLRRRPLGRGDLYPQVPETLDHLVSIGAKLAICSNKPVAATIDALEGTGIHHCFDAVIGGDSLAERKPAAAPLRAAVERLGVPVARSVMVGDNANDVGSARKLGRPVVCVSYGYARMAPTALGADVLIDSFEALPRALEDLSGR